MSIDQDIFRVLANKSRVQILKLLYQKPRSIQELAKELGFQPITIRHHVQLLMEKGLLESYEERSGVQGRPKAYYKIAKSIPMVSFPQRQYLALSTFLLKMLKLELGEEKIKPFLVKLGHEMAKETIIHLADEHKIKEWSIKEFNDILVNQYFKNMGSESEVVEISDTKIKFRFHNCIFFELSKEMPDLMCDILHTEFHRGLALAMNKQVNDVQRTCMGHGDNYCEHEVEFK